MSGHRMPRLRLQSPHLRIDSNGQLTNIGAHLPWTWLQLAGKTGSRGIGSNPSLIRVCLRAFLNIEFRIHFNCYFCVFSWSVTVPLSPLSFPPHPSIDQAPTSRKNSDQSNES